MDGVSKETETLARHISSAAARALPEQVAERGRMHLLDTLAAAVSGSTLAAGKQGAAWLNASFAGAGPASVLGTTGITAYVGMHDVGQVKAGSNVLVSSATGGVGGVAVQLARV